MSAAAHAVAVVDICNSLDGLSRTALHLYHEERLAVKRGTKGKRVRERCSVLRCFGKSRVVGQGVGTLKALGVGLAALRQVGMRGGSCARAPASTCACQVKGKPLEVAGVHTEKAAASVLLRRGEAALVRAGVATASAPLDPAMATPRIPKKHRT